MTIQRLIRIGIFAVLNVMAIGAVSGSLEGAEQPVIVVPVNGEIEDALFRIIERAVIQVTNRDARALILHMDTFGGELKATESIMQLLSRVSVPTYTFVDTKAISAGALICSATKTIYMAPQGQIGDAKVIQMTLFGSAEAIDDDLREKLESPVRAIVRSACERNGHNYQLFESMMDERVAVSNLVEKGKLLTLTSYEAVTQGLAKAVVRTLDELIDQEGFGDAPLEVVRTKSKEQLARFLASGTVSTLLLLLGLGGLFIELRTPGIGLPGLIGIVCLGLFFWGHMIAGLSGWFHVALFVTGLVLLLIEIFVIPGFGLTGISGIACMLAALVLTIGDWSDKSMIVNELSKSLAIVTGAIAGALVLLALVAKFLPRAPYLNRIFLEKTISSADGYSVRNEADLRQWAGKSGIAKTTLRPAGKAQIEGTLLDVVTMGDYVEKNTPIIVISTESNRIVVEPADGDIKA